MNLQQWEYRHLSIDSADGDLTEQLNELGAQFWEIVAVNFGEITEYIDQQNQTRPYLDVLMKRAYVSVDIPGGTPLSG